MDNIHAVPTAAITKANRDEQEMMRYWLSGPTKDKRTTGTVKVNITPNRVVQTLGSLIPVYETSLNCKKYKTVIVTRERTDNKVNEIILSTNFVL